MQFNTLPNSASQLSFDIIAPKPGSTRHVAAAAFYHCLGKVLMCPCRLHGSRSASAGDQEFASFQATGTIWSDLHCYREMRSVEHYFDQLIVVPISASHISNPQR